MTRRARTTAVTRPARTTASTALARTTSLTKLERTTAFIGLSIPLNVVMVAWKTALVVVAPSLFLLATVIFYAGITVAKGYVVRHLVEHTRSLGRGKIVVTNGDSPATQRTIFRTVGILIFVLSVFYIVCCAPGLAGTGHVEQYEKPLALAIATVTFAEIIVASCEAVAARRRNELAVEAVRLTSLASAFILLVLTQTALMSIAFDGDARVFNAISAIVFGGLAAVVGIYMILRSQVSTSSVK